MCLLLDFGARLCERAVAMETSVLDVLGLIPHVFRMYRELSKG